MIDKLARSGLIAINTNRLGDIFIIIYLINSLYLISTHIQIIITFLILGFMFKSISLISFLWLPQTPVSALLHSCTLVMADYLHFINGI